MELHSMGCASRRLAVPVAAILIWATLPGVSAAVNPAGAIAAAAGHPSRLHLLAEARRIRDGETETTTLETVAGQRLERTCIDDLCSGTWFDGRASASFGINGTPLTGQAEDDGVERTFGAIMSTAFAEPEFLASGGRIATLAVAAGDAQLRYRVTAPQGTELIAVADARTRRLTGVELADRRPYRQLSATVSGTTIFYGPRAYDRVVATDAPLVPPAGPPVSITGPSDLALLSDALPVVSCSLSGRPARCLIDTGTTPSSVTLDFAEKLGREPYGRIEIAGLKDYLTGVIDAGPLMLAGATFDRLKFAVIPGARGAGFDVIIGSDALDGLRVAFDLRHRRVSVAPPRQPLDRPITLRFRGGLPYVEVQLGTRAGSEPMLVDTGDSETLSIGYDEYRKDLQLFAADGAVSAAGVDGISMDAVQGRIESAEVGGERIDRVPISAVRGQHTGHVGFGFAARCGEFVVELGRGEIECRPKSKDTRASTGDR